MPQSTIEGINLHRVGPPIGISIEFTQQIEIGIAADALPLIYWFLHEIKLQLLECSTITPVYFSDINFRSVDFPDPILPSIDIRVCFGAINIL